MPRNIQGTFKEHSGNAKEHSPCLALAGLVYCHNAHPAGAAAWVLSELPRRILRLLDIGLNDLKPDVNLTHVPEAWNTAHASEETSHLQGKTNSTSRAPGIDKAGAEWLWRAQGNEGFLFDQNIMRDVVMSAALGVHMYRDMQCYFHSLMGAQPL
jgi:hypothetical protein